MAKRKFQIGDSVYFNNKQLGIVLDYDVVRGRYLVHIQSMIKYELAHLDWFMNGNRWVVWVLPSALTLAIYEDDLDNWV